MMDMKEFYILGLPVDTPIGHCTFLKVKDYPDYFMPLQIVGLTKNHIVSKYSELNKDGSLDEFMVELRNSDMFEIAMGIPEIHEAYLKLFIKLFNDENILLEVTKENFDYYRKLVMTMNCLKEEVINPNPEIQAAIERSRRVKSQEGEKLEFSDIVTSVVGYNGLTYSDINEFSLYQLYMTYYRIAQFKNYDTTTLFATVSADKIKIDSWSKHINLYEDEKYAITQDEFNNAIGTTVND
ncbi:hypothetical protein [Cytobacillus gottheilii]|uniref:hypothetical protein n=1 Tax=Cytobacillus gottheilii TaxID=859144 RepID=UPI0009BA8CA0|nr:hypothetical protein [Cytobacillus gottheilii]